MEIEVLRTCLDCSGTYVEGKDHVCPSCGSRLGQESAALTSEERAEIIRELVPQERGLNPVTGTRWPDWVLPVVVMSIVIFVEWWFDLV